MSNTHNPTNYPALYALVGVFFFWGFIAASNGVFIPFCKSKFELSQFQSQLIDSAFYFAYYIGAFLLFLFSVMGRKDFLNSWGFKNGIVYGLMISVIGAFLMYPALSTSSFAFILASLFIIGLGFSVQQTAANPLAIMLGDPATGSNRLNLAGGVNSFGTTIGPIIFALALLGTTHLDESKIVDLSLSTVQWLYIAIGFAFLLAGLLFYLSKKIPDNKNNEPFENEAKATQLLSLITVILIVVLGFIFVQNTGVNTQQHTKTALYLTLSGIMALVLGLLFANIKSKKSPEGWGALKYPQLTFGMLAIFVYVGVEVTIQSNLGEYLKHIDYSAYLTTSPNTSFNDFLGLLSSNMVEGHWTSMTPMLISLYWGSLMIGRWAGAVSAFNLSSKNRRLALIIIPYIAFLVIAASNMVAGVPTEKLILMLPYAAVVLIQILGFFAGQDKPSQTLFIFGLLGVTAMLTGMFTTGAVSVFAFVSGGLFCSVMWPVIFSLSLQGLGKFTSQGSAFLVMMILGGAFLPPLQGKIADLLNITVSYWVPAIGFVYLALFAVIVKGFLRKQNITI